LIVDLRFSIARPSLDFQSKVASRNRRKYWPGIFFSISALLGNFMNISKHWIGLPSVCDRPAIYRR
jgi:hypothetical protein